MASYALACTLTESDPEASLAAAEECISLSGPSSLIYNSALVQTCLIRMQLNDDKGAISALRVSLSNSHAQGDLPQLSSSVPLAAVLVQRCGREEAAAVIFSLTSNGPLSGYLGVPAAAVEDCSAALAMARDRLGPERFAKATTRGANMSYHEAVEFVFTELDAASVS
jgi:hypothetical protein